MDQDIKKEDNDPRGFSSERKHRQLTCQEKKEEKDMPPLKIAAIYQYTDTRINKIKTNYSDQKQYKQHKDQWNNNY